MEANEVKEAEFNQVTNKIDGYNDFVSEVTNNLEDALQNEIIDE